MEGFYHLRYDADVLRGERDKLLNISFANVPLGEEERKGAEAGTAKPVLFMFIGVFSEGHAVAKRDAVRTAWCSAAEQQASAVCRWVWGGLYEVGGSMRWGVVRGGVHVCVHCIFPV